MINTFPPYENYRLSRTKDWTQLAIGLMSVGKAAHETNETTSTNQFVYKCLTPKLSSAIELDRNNILASIN